MQYNFKLFFELSLDKIFIEWLHFQGALRQISVGSNSVWGVSADGRVLARIGISDESPTGREWSTVDADSMKHVIYICSPLNIFDP